MEKVKFTLQFSKDFYEKVKNAAKENEMTIASYIRYCIMRVWKEEKGE